MIVLPPSNKIYIKITRHMKLVFTFYWNCYRCRWPRERFAELLLDDCVLYCYNESLSVNVSWAVRDTTAYDAGVYSQVSGCRVITPYHMCRLIFYYCWFSLQSYWVFAIVINGYCYSIDFILQSSGQKRLILSCFPGICNIKVTRKISNAVYSSSS